MKPFTIILKFKHILLVPLALTILSCVRDGGDECESFLRFVYDYNIGGADMISPGVDKFHLQASKVDVFVFSSAGIYLGRESRTVSEGTFPKEFLLSLPDMYGQGVQLITWSGLYAAHYEVAEMIPGFSVMEDLRVSLKTDDEKCDRKLQPLWHGTLTGQHSRISYTNEINEINLVKNTNSIRLNLEIADGDNSVLDADEFEVTIFSDNCHHDYTNCLIDSDGVMYHPFIHETNPFTGVASEFRVLRLMEDRVAVLKVVHSTTGDILLEKDLTPYLYASRLHDYQSMPMQEYLDRQDEYRVIMFLSYDPSTGKYGAFSLQINDWLIHLSDENIIPDRG